jgi:hypothetical protein
MKVSGYIDFLVSTSCSKLAVSNVGDMSLNPDVAPSTVQLANQDKFVDYVNLANLAVHKRFQLIEKQVELDNPVSGEEFDLPTDFLIPLEAYYAADFDPVTIKDPRVQLVDSVDTKVSILIPEPFKALIKGTDDEARSLIIMKYSASPKVATNSALDLKVSQVYTECILNYAAYMAHSAISGDIKDENNTYYLRYEASCKQVVNSGMWGAGEQEINTKLDDNGFV